MEPTNCIKNSPFSRHILLDSLQPKSTYNLIFTSQLIAAGGDAVSNAGQNIINSAHLIPPKGHSGYSHTGSGGSAAFFAKLSGSSSGLSSGSSGSGVASHETSHESMKYCITIDRFES
jgi:hypothetical protein